MHYFVCSPLVWDSEMYLLSEITWAYIPSTLKTMEYWVWPTHFLWNKSSKEFTKKAFYSQSILQSFWWLFQVFPLVFYFLWKKKLKNKGYIHLFIFHGYTNSQGYKSIEILFKHVIIQHEKLHSVLQLWKQDSGVRVPRFESWDSNSSLATF
jgi:hypothetical protein